MWTKAPPPLLSPLPLLIRGLVKRCIEERGRTCSGSPEERDRGDIEPAFVGIGVKTKLSARAHSSLMFIDEETGGPQQGIVSPKWRPLIARKPRLFLASDGWSSF